MRQIRVTLTQEITDQVRRAFAGSLAQRVAKNKTQALAFEIMKEVKREAQHLCRVAGLSPSGLTLTRIRRANGLCHFDWIAE